MKRVLKGDLKGDARPLIDMTPAHERSDWPTLKLSCRPYDLVIEIIIEDISLKLIHYNDWDGNNPLPTFDWNGDNPLPTFYWN